MVFKHRRIRYKIVNAKSSTYKINWKKTIQTIFLTENRSNARKNRNKKVAQKCKRCKNWKIWATRLAAEMANRQKAAMDRRSMCDANEKGKWADSDLLFHHHHRHSQGCLPASDQSPNPYNTIVSISFMMIIFVSFRVNIWGLRVWWIDGSTWAIVCFLGFAQNYHTWQHKRFASEE